ncbi:hypothetical protein X797_012134, partial [Metarhizium robertsii]
MQQDAPIPALGSSQLNTDFTFRPRPQNKDLQYVQRSKSPSRGPPDGRVEHVEAARPEAAPAISGGHRIYRQANSQKQLQDVLKRAAGVEAAQVQVRRQRELDHLVRASTSHARTNHVKDNSHEPRLQQQDSGQKKIFAAKSAASRAGDDTATWMESQVKPLPEIQQSQDSAVSISSTPTRETTPGTQLPESSLAQSPPRVPKMTDTYRPSVPRNEARGSGLARDGGYISETPSPGPPPQARLQAPSSMEEDSLAAAPWELPQYQHISRADASNEPRTPPRSQTGDRDRESSIPGIEALNLGDRSSLASTTSEKSVRDRSPIPLLEAFLARFPITIRRLFDIDSAWFAPLSLAVIRAPNDFRLTFLPRFSLHISTDQVVQPHRLSLERTRHVLGSFQTGPVRFSAFVLFPSSADSPRSKMSASSNTLSHERLQEFYDEIIFPAIREAIKDPFHQEIPQSFYMVYAMSRSSQEKPATGQRSDLARFWSLVVEKANLLRIPTKGGENVAYFKNPRLLFQAHDLKNTFARPRLHETFSSFGDTALAGLDPDQLDMRSCWIDIGARYYADGPGVRQRGGTEPITLLWKSQCNRHLHESLVKIAPGSPLSATHFRSFLLRDTGNVMFKTIRSRTVDARHPDSRQPGVTRVKAYNSNKRIFGLLIDRNYSLYNSPSLLLAALNQDMIQDLDSVSKRSGPEAVMNYGVRKELTFCLSAILKEWSDSSFDTSRNTHTSPFSRVLQLGPDSDVHCPIWMLPTRDLKDLIFTQAARLVLPLDHLFQLLVYTFSSERDYNFDKWIWLSTWNMEKSRGEFWERRGRGLEAPIKASGMLWIPRDLIDWRRGHVALAALIDLYIPRSPLQSRLTSQKN